MPGIAGLAGAMLNLVATAHRGCPILALEAGLRASTTARLNGAGADLRRVRICAYVQQPSMTETENPYIHREVCVSR